MGLSQIHGFLTTALLAFLAGETVSLDPNFTACEPRSCGVGPEIRYPFWIAGVQKPSCGYPGFRVRCVLEHPLMEISKNAFIISQIFDGNCSFLVSHAGVLFEKCPDSLHNFTLNRTPFNYSGSHADLSVFYNCTVKPVNFPVAPLECASNSSHGSFVGFGDDLSAESCASVVRVPVGGDGGGVLNTTGMDAEELLARGFLLNWTAPRCSRCSSTGGRCGFHDGKVDCFCSNGPSKETCAVGKKRDWVLKTIIGVVAAVVGMGLACLAVFIYQRRRKNRFVLQSSLLPRSLSSSGPSPKTAGSEKGGIHAGVHIFTYDELEEATNNFDSTKELGDGGFGAVYHGKLRDGRCVAVKRLYENNYRRLEQFMNEVEILTRLRHKNLVSLYGSTSGQSRELLLVYEFVANGTVASHLHGDRATAGALSWTVRMSIAAETASALTYLHFSEIVHRDVKTDNILLDENFCVKVADFGLSRLFPTQVTHVSTAPQGTPGYVDPEYHQCYQLTSKSDVYSFGVVLVELLSSKPAVDITRHRQEINLANMAMTKIQNNSLHELVDPSLGFETDGKVRRMVEAVAELAFQCLQSEKEMRPSMEEVLETLRRTQKEGFGVEDGESPADDTAPLRRKPPPIPPSPDSVTATWVSTSTTPNASG